MFYVKIRMLMYQQGENNNTFTRTIKLKQLEINWRKIECRLFVSNIRETADDKKYVSIFKFA